MGEAAAERGCEYMEGGVASDEEEDSSEDVGSEDYDFDFEESRPLCRDMKTKDTCKEGTSQKGGGCVWCLDPDPQSQELNSYVGLV